MDTALTSTPAPLTLALGLDLHAFGARRTRPVLPVGPFVVGSSYGTRTVKDTVFTRLLTRAFEALTDCSSVVT